MIMESGKWQYHIMMQVRYDNRTINVYGIMYEWFHYHNEYLIAKHEEGRKWMYYMEK